MTSSAQHPDEFERDPQIPRPAAAENTLPEDSVSEAEHDVRGIKRKAVSAAATARDGVVTAAQRAVQTADASRGPVAAGLESAASVLHKQADNVYRLAHRAADQLDRGADYTRHHDARSMLHDVQSALKQHPAACLAAAVAAGFWCGRAIRRR
ncbi:MAG TPA: hypothetical protein VN661_04890 [Candidatus Acidoferrales bacterium]|nr:hypothetical protein [Candidatus Acidoferrales bacterium]